MIKNLLNQEKGIALTVAIFVMIALFLIAGAYFISTQNEASNSLSNKAGAKAIEVAAVGAERAIWYIQQKLDTDPNWHPATDNSPLLNTDYDYFASLGGDKRDPHEYAQRCVQVGSTQPGVTSGNIAGEGSQVYAVKIRKEDNPNTPDVVEWAIYSLGIDRTQKALSKMKIQGVKVLVQLGQQQQQVNIPTISSGQYNPSQDTHLYPSTSFHLDGPGNTAEFYTANNIDDTTLGRNPNGNYGIVPPGDGIDSTSQFKLSYSPNTTVPTTGIIYDSNHIIKNEVTTPPPFPNIDFSKITPDYTADQLVAAGKWVLLTETQNGISYKHYEFNPTRPGGVAFVGSLTTMDSEIKRIDTTYGNIFMPVGDNSDYPTHDYYDTYSDRNGDGFVVIQIPDYSLRVGSLLGKGFANIKVFPNTHVIIVAQGSGNNEYGNGNMGEIKLNTNVSIEIREEIMTPPYCQQQGQSYIQDYYVDSISGKPKIGPDTKTILNLYTMTMQTVPIVQPEDPMLGTFDILAQNDVIFAHESGSASRARSRIRGMVYSKNGTVDIGQDILLQGAIAAGRGVSWRDEGALPGLNFYSSGDGIDTALWYENPISRITDEHGFNPSIPATWLGGGTGVGTGKIKIISWENVGSNLKNTF